MDTTTDNEKQNVRAAERKSEEERTKRREEREKRVVKERDKEKVRRERKTDLSQFRFSVCASVLFFSDDVLLSLYRRTHVVFDHHMRLCEKEVPVVCLRSCLLP
jgi:hypothetical protein